MLYNTKQRPKEFDDLLNRASELAERSHQRFTKDNPRFVERYIKGDFWFVLIFAILVEGVREEHAAFFQRMGRCEEFIVYEKSADVWWQVGPFSENGTEDVDAVGNSGGDQHPVLVSDIEHMQPPEIIVATPVRFETPNQVFSGLTHTHHFSIKAGCNRGAIVDGEVDMTLLRLGVSNPLSVAAYQSEGQIIQGTAQVVQNLASEQGNVAGNDRHATSLEHDCAGFQLIFTNDAVVIGVPERFNSSFKLLELVFGPCDS